MTNRFQTVLLTMVILAGAMPAAGQTTTRTPPLTPWGDPDLQGQWNSQTSIPLERPLEGPLAAKESLTEEQAAAFERENRARYDLPPNEGSPGTYNAFWRDFGNPLTRMSLIVDPPDGRIPALTQAGRMRLDAEAAARSTRGPNDSPDTYADLSNWTRCISRGWNGIGSWYSSNYQIFQVPGYVVVFQELIHEPRIIPLDGGPHLSDSVRLWLGDSRGHWEGDTLVVETTNFDSRTNFRGSRDTLHLTEHYRRVNDDTLDYRFTITDPHTFTRPWTVVRPMTRIDIAERRSIFEYACHEGNYGMVGILAGARAEERAERADIRFGR